MERHSVDEFPKRFIQLGSRSTETGCTYCALHEAEAARDCDYSESTNHLLYGSPPMLSDCICIGCTVVKLL